MTEFTAPDPAYRTRIAESFARQPFVQFIGAELVHVAPGKIDIRLPRTRNVLQQHGYIHGGALTTLADAAAGYAAMTLASAGDGVLTTELKVNFLRPADGEDAIARGRVVKAGRTLSVVQADVFASTNGVESHVLTSLVSMMHIEGLLDRRD